MKKLLTMAAIAAMSFGAQASVTWTLDITNCEVGTDPSGTIPTVLGLRLIDKNGGSGSYREVYSATIDFTQFTQGSEYVAKQRFDIVRYIGDKGTSSITVEDSKKSSTATLKLEYYGVNGYQAHFSVDLADDVYGVYPSGVTKQQAIELAKNFAAEFTGYSGTYQLTESSTSGNTQLLIQGTLDDIVHPGPVDPTPTPEPTSGLLMLLGMAGLALKRKRA